MIRDLEKIKFSRDHCWVKMIEDFTAVCGISSRAAEGIGAVLFVNLPEIRREMNKGDRVGYLESVKMIFDIRAPLSGEIIGVNDELILEPNLAGFDPMDRGWLMKIDVKYRIEFEDLLDEEEYNMLDFF